MAVCHLSLYASAPSRHATQAEPRRTRKVVAVCHCGGSWALPASHRVLGLGMLAAAWTPPKRRSLKGKHGKQTAKGQKENEKDNGNQASLLDHFYPGFMMFYVITSFLNFQCLRCTGK